MHINIFCFRHLTIHCQLADRNALQIRHVPKGRENDEARQDAGQRVGDGYEQRVPEGEKMLECVPTTLVIIIICRECEWVTWERCCWRSCSWTWPGGSRSRSRWSWRFELQHWPTPAKQNNNSCITWACRGLSALLSLPRPDLHRQQLVPLWHNEEGDPVRSTGELHVIDQQGDQNDVREQGGEVHHLHINTGSETLFTRLCQPLLYF